VTQPGFEQDLETSFAQMERLTAKFYEGRITRGDSYSDLSRAYRRAKRIASRHRREARMRDPTIIDLDSTTDIQMSHISTRVHWEKVAMDASYKMINITRSELTALREIERLCYQVIMLVDRTGGMDTCEYRARMTAAWASIEQKSLSRDLKKFGNSR
jgi:hypothetical protein